MTNFNLPQQRKWTKDSNSKRCENGEIILIKERTSESDEMNYGKTHHQ